MLPSARRLFKSIRISRLPTMSTSAEALAPQFRIPPIVLAPLLGVTTATFRRVFRRHFGGVHRAMSPFIPVPHGKRPPWRHFKDILPQANRDSLPLIPQLIGRDGADFRETANAIHDELGYEEVNWNLGCPAPTVTARGRGAGMLATPDRIEAFLATACAGLRCRLSIKMRLGLERDDEALALVDCLNRHPIAEVTIHPRTGRQQYEGQADVERFGQLKALLAHPVAYNGDIDATARAQAICARFPDLSSLMLGRALIANPWLPAAIRDARPEREAWHPTALARFHDDLVDAYQQSLEGGDGPVLAKMKELWGYWAPDFPDARQVLKSRNLAEYRERSARAFEAPGPRRASRFGPTCRLAAGPS